MKCPLLTEIARYPDCQENTYALECLGEECAWWAPLSSCCSIRDLPGILIAAGNVLGRIHAELCLSRYTYTCHYCSVRIQKTAAGEFKYPSGWKLEEQTDGRHVWICDQCYLEGRG